MKEKQHIYSSTNFFFFCYFSVLKGYFTKLWNLPPRMLLSTRGGCSTVDYRTDTALGNECFVATGVSLTAYHWMLVYGTLTRALQFDSN